MILTYSNQHLTQVHFIGLSTFSSFLLFFDSPPPPSPPPPPPSPRGHIQKADSLTKVQVAREFVSFVTCYFIAQTAKTLQAVLNSKDIQKTKELHSLHLVILFHALHTQQPARQTASQVLG
jgi:hypothetical protein